MTPVTVTNKQEWVLALASKGVTFESSFVSSLIDDHVMFLHSFPVLQNLT